MTYQNFAVTAMGRSGTMYVARALNSSPSWDVEHEPNGLNDLHGVRPRFERHWYGEVNSHLRVCFMRLPVMKRAVILRDPYALYLSMVNRWGCRPPLHVLEAMRYGLELLDLYIKLGVWSFTFESLVRSVDSAMGHLAVHLGIYDLPEDYPKDRINDNKVNEFCTFDELPESNKKWAYRHMCWFKVKHHL